MATMKKILVLSNNSKGLLSFRKEVLDAICANGYEVVAAIPKADYDSYTGGLKARLIPLINLNRRGINPVTDLKLMREFRKIITTEKPDVVLTYTIKPNIYGGMVCSSRKVPFIVNITGLGSAVENPGWLQKLTVGMYRRAMRGAGKIFFQNSANKDFFRSRDINVAAHAQIPGSGVNLSHHVIQSYPETDSPVRFLYISRLLKEKGIEEYFAVARHFHELKADVEFHILGACEEDYKEQLAELEKHGIVKYHGVQKDVRPFIARSHCLIHPSFYPEGMSNVLLESSAAGRPVITTRRPGCREIVDEGVNGYLIDPRDTEGLIEAVGRFLSLSHSEKEKMGIAGRRKMEREFDRNIVVKAYLDAIREIIK